MGNQDKGADNPWLTCPRCLTRHNNDRYKRASLFCDDCWPVIKEENWQRYLRKKAVKDEPPAQELEKFVDDIVARENLPPWEKKKWREARNM